MSMVAVVVAIAILGILIFVHEWGHFIAARSQGIHVNRFSIGFGPLLWKFQGKETEYALRLIPLGGYVGFPDDDPNSGVPANDPNLLSNRPILDRAIVISAGVIANLVFAYLLLLVQVGVMGISQATYHEGVLIPALVPESSLVATKAGIQPGDLVLAVDGQPLGADANSLPNLMRAIQQHPQQPLTLTIQRQGHIQEITVTPEVSEEGQARIGVQLAPHADIHREHTLNPLKLITAAAAEFQRVIVLTLDGFRELFQHFDQAAQQVSGPVAIVAMGADIARSNAEQLFTFTALISINLAIINILPFPALDGGQLLFLVVEALRGRPLPNRIQEGVMQTGLVLLLGLGMFLIVRDTVNLTGLGWVQQLF
ncbi:MULTISPECIES: RIP metalloprotease RseP [unclassified Thermosynechococcus]|uniref:RIP metalloprotease RseP n=1 Tax=unclassified Thermosynechococcus TaxID=2622553 RepID=UPI00059E83FC|nr:MULTISPECIES: RIP metalloprotease RseP [unclassified Thermosynechococcus]HIK24160.1 RIP metalloprotease RseP [Thermosynechococcus sp. M3746_W2019_013]